MKHLLLISNVSSKNEHLVSYAAQFCKYYQCKLHILHFSKYQDPVLVSSPHYYEQNDVKFNQSENQLVTEKVGKIINKFLDFEQVQIEIKKGNQQQVLNSFISDHFIDMIMIGNTDLEGKSEFEDHKNILMNVIDTPIVVIPEFEPFEPYHKFSFLTTHTGNDLEHLIQLADLFPKAIIKLMHFTKQDANQNQKGKKWLEMVKNEVSNKLEYQLIMEDVEKHIRLESKSIIKLANAFVFTTHKRGFWKRLFDPSTTLSFLAGLEAPSIIFKIEDKP